MIDELIYQALGGINITNTLTEQDSTPYVVFNSRSESSFTRDNKAYIEDIQVIFIVVADTLVEALNLKEEIIEKMLIMTKENKMKLYRHGDEKSVEEGKHLIVLEISINKFL